MTRRVFSTLTASAAWAQRRPPAPSGYVDWSWERWRAITRESRPVLRSDQSGRAGLADLLRFQDREIASPEEWQARRNQLRSLVDAILGPPPPQKPPLAAETLEEVPQEGYLRRLVRFQTEPGEFIPGYLLLPAGRSRFPAVICPHQTVQHGKAEPAGLAGNPQLHTALHLVRHGFATFTYDAACFGERHDPATGHYGDAIPFYRRHPRWSMMGKMVWDLSRAIDYLETLEFIDSTRIGSIGHSHGGYTTWFAMALDERLKAGVSSCGFDTFRYDGNVWRWSHATALLPRLGFYISSRYINMRNYNGVPDSETIQTPLDTHFVLALIAPRPLMLTAADDDAIFANSGWSTRQAVAKLEPLYQLFGASERLHATYFRGGHSLPMELADRAYTWLARWLRG